ncbi:MAG: response regulator [Desulfobacterales bacterium]
MQTAINSAVSPMDRILVIDDEAAIVRVLAMSLRADGYEVLTANSGQDGLAQFQTHHPEIVLTDIKMPGVEGIEVLQRIKRHTAESAAQCEVIIVTGHGDIDNAIEALKFGASDFLTKPIRDAALSVALERAREKLSIRRQLRAYTENLEVKVAEATRELRRQSNFLAKLIRSSNDGIIATDQALTIVIMNPGAERIFGYPADEVIGNLKIGDLYPADVAAHFEGSSPQNAGNAEPTWRESAIRAKDGTLIPVRFSGTLLHEAGKMMGSVAFFQDLREIKRLEQELVQSERLAAIGQTVAGVAHGVKNILYGFKGGRYLVELGLKREDQTKLTDGWGMVKRNIERTSDLVLDLLAYAKSREPELVPGNPNAIIREVCELLEARAGEHNVVLECRLDSALGDMLLDPRILHGALMNLVTNAIDACMFDIENAKDWQVTLTTCLEPGNSGSSDGDPVPWVRVDVADNGTGMSPEVQEKLFRSFFSTKGHQGTGLGLLVTRKIIEEHGGTIQVTSRVGEGTLFSIRLPYLPPPNGLKGNESSGNLLLAGNFS